MQKEIFELKPEHLTLMKRMFVNWNSDMYEGAPEIDIKRPYGNKDVYGDIAEMLGWKLMETSDGEMVMTKEQGEQAKKFHEEMATALQIVLSNQSFETGEYIKTSDYDALSWRLRKNSR